MNIISVEIDHRAQHQIRPNGCVKLPYKGYIISLGSDSESVHVYRTFYGKEVSNPDFESDLYTGPHDLGERIRLAMEYIDNQITRNEGHI